MTKMYERSIQNILDIYTTYIGVFGDKLRNFFSGIYTLFQIEFLKKESIEIVFQKEIYLINFGTNIGSEYNGLRPGLVVSNGRINMGSLIFVIPLSSFAGKKVFRNDFVIEPSSSNGLDEKSIIRTTHIYCISKKRLVKKLGICHDDLFHSIRETTIGFFDEK